MKSLLAVLILLASSTSLACMNHGMGPHGDFFINSYAPRMPQKPSFQEKKTAKPFFSFRGAQTNVEKKVKGKKKSTATEAKKPKSDKNKKDETPSEA